jgi:hypothetical protein
MLEDRTGEDRSDGFLELARLTLQNIYEDGSESTPYACDVVSRPGSDAVVAVLYKLDGRRVSVVVREAPRAPIYLRRSKTFEHPDPREYLSIHEVVAGMVEPGDGAGPAGLCRRAAIEAEEEAGFHMGPEDFRVIGDETFASPGISDEKVYYCAGSVSTSQRSEPRGDGSVMEECAELVEFDLGVAIEACRSGKIPDMKTEIGLLRLADHLGYLPQLDCFVDDLPRQLQSRYRRLGVAPATQESD